MRRRQHNFKVTNIFADGTVMSEEELLSKGKVIKAEDNMELEREARRIFCPEYAAEAKKVAKFQRTEKRRQELLAELAILEKK